MSAILKQKLIDIANGFTKYGLWKGDVSKADLDVAKREVLESAEDYTEFITGYDASKGTIQPQIDTLNSNLGKHKYIVLVRGGIIPASTTTGWHTVTLTFTNIKTLEGAIAMQRFKNQSQKAIVLTDLSGNQAEFGYYGTLSYDLNIIAIGVGIAK